MIIAEEHGGFAFGGNKVRQVDRLLGAAKVAGADTVITSAGPQSNLCRVMAAAARHAGMDVHLVLRGTPPDEPTGNQRVYELSEANLHWLPSTDPFDPAQSAAMTEIADRLRRSGRTPYVVDVREADAGTSCALASSVIVDELADGLAGTPPDRIVLAASAGNTAGGILATLAARQATIELVAVSAGGSESELRERILDRARAVLERADLTESRLADVRLTVTDAHLGAGHGAVTDDGVQAQRRTARHCGIYLDLTYTAKAMAGLLADPRPGRSVFIHTGGGPTVFAPPGTSVPGGS